MDWFTLENHGRITSDGKINGRYMMDKVHNLLKFMGMDWFVRENRRKPCFFPNG